MKKVKRIARSFLLLAVVALLFCTSVHADGPVSLTTSVLEHGKDMLHYGHVDLDIPADELLKSFDYGDLVSVKIDGREEFIVPVCPEYDAVAPGELLLRAVPGKDHVTFAINYGSIALILGIAVKAPETAETTYIADPECAFPLNAVITLNEKNGYKDGLAISSMKKTETIDAYPDRTEEEFANFREVRTTGMGPGKLYRSASPIYSGSDRSAYADRFAKEAGVRTFINLMDRDESAAASYPDFYNTYYSTQNIVYNAMPVAYSSELFRDLLAKAMQGFADYEPPFLVHCQEGKDRAGFAAALLECLMGADIREIQEDYVKTFINYYDVIDDIQQPLPESVIEALENRIVSILSGAFGIDTDQLLSDPAKEAESYLIRIGLSEESILKIKENLK